MEVGISVKLQKEYVLKFEVEPMKCPAEPPQILVGTTLISKSVVCNSSTTSIQLILYQMLTKCFCVLPEKLQTP